MDKLTLKNSPFQSIFRILLFLGGLSFIIDFILHFFKLSLISSSSLEYGDGGKTIYRGGTHLVVAVCLYCILAFQQFNGLSKKAKHFRTYFLVAHSIFSLIILNLFSLGSNTLIPTVKTEFLWTAYLLTLWYFLVWIFWFLQKYEWPKK